MVVIGIIGLFHLAQKGIILNVTNPSSPLVFRLVIERARWDGHVGQAVEQFPKDGINSWVAKGCKNVAQGCSCAI